MSWLKKLFGGGAIKAEPAAEPVEYKGYQIYAAPFIEEGQHQTCGTITRLIDGEMKEHRFIRADRFASRDEAIEVTLRKAYQLIDEQGERIFS